MKNTFVVTCYYPQILKPIAIGAKNSKTLAATDETYRISFGVDKRIYSKYVCEATGIISDPLHVFHGLALSRYGNKNHISPYPFGVGNLLNPIIPGRDFASNHLPFGTRIEILDKKLGLSKYYYRGDVFGIDAKANRIDLYQPLETNLYKPVNVNITLPTEDFYTRDHVIKYVQNFFNSLGFDKLVVDGIEGPQTKQVLGDFNTQYQTNFLSACDSELVFMLGNKLRKK